MFYAINNIGECGRAVGPFRASAQLAEWCIPRGILVPSWGLPVSSLLARTRPVKSYVWCYNNIIL